MFQKLKPHLKWAVPLAVIVILVIVFLIGQSPEVISATVSPEVIVKGQNQEVTVTAVVRRRGVVPPIIFVTLSEPKKVEDYNTFKGKSTWFGLLKKSTKDNSGNYIYQRTFVVNHNKAETVQVRLRNLVGFFIYPVVKTDSTTVWPITLPTLRLAVSTRSFSLPQDPGEEGKKTLAGIDSDNDGVRDDIQREIFFAFPESERVRVGIKQGMIASVTKMFDNSNRQKVNVDIKNELKSISCVNGLINGVINDKVFDRYLHLFENLKYLTQNTTNRLRAFSTADSLTDSSSNYDHPKIETQSCDFNWQEMAD